MIHSHTELEAYGKALDVAMRIFELSKCFPREETYSLTDQVRRSSRSVCANIAEAWRKRRYRAAFCSKLCECEGEAAETQAWIEIAVKCGYLSRDDAAPLYQTCEEVIRLLVSIIRNPDPWLMPLK